jgi:NTP pyrophosphatase (non-canonical NTP hydrolase)
VRNDEQPTTLDTLAENDPVVLAAVLDRLARHDQVFGVNWPAERNQLRLALATIEDEHLEAYEAWRAGKRAGDWTELADELLDVAAVALRALRELADPHLRAELTRRHADACFAGDFVHKGEDSPANPACFGCGHLADEHGDEGCGAPLEMSHSSRPCPCLLTSWQVGGTAAPHASQPSAADEIESED